VKNKLINGKTIRQHADEAGVNYQTMYWRLVGKNNRKKKVRFRNGKAPALFNSLLGIPERK